MDYLSHLLAIAVFWTIAAVIPGPNFLMVARTAVVHSRSAALRATAGIGVGTATWGLAAFFGVHVLFTVVPWLYAGLKMAGGIYLVWVGVRLLWQSFAAEDAAAGPPSVISNGAAFRLGFATNMANPKSAAFAASLFAVTLPPEPAFDLGLMAVAAMVAISLVWYALVSVVFASRRISGAYGRFRRWLDRIAGVIFAGFGAKMASDA